MNNAELTFSFKNSLRFREITQKTENTILQLKCLEQSSEETKQEIIFSYCEGKRIEKERKIKAYFDCSV